MEPFTLIALGLLGARFLTGSAKREARESYDAASRSYRYAVSDAKRQQLKTVDSLQDFASNRGACLLWLQPRLNAVLQKIGLSDRVFAPQLGPFGGRTLAQVRDLLARARDIVIPPRGVFDNQVALASGAALLIEGIQFVDGVGLANLPVLHETVHDAVAGIPIDGTHGVADALGGFGDFNVADLLGDALVVFGLFKVGYNLWKTQDLADKESSVLAATSRVEDFAARLARGQKSAEALAETQHERAYQTFKWMMLADVAASMSDRARGRRLEWIRENLWRSLGPYWKALEQPVAI